MTFGSHGGWRAVINHDRSALTRRVTAIAVRDTGSVTYLYRRNADGSYTSEEIDPRANGWDALPGDAALLNVPEDVARALYEALRDYFGDGNRQTVGVLEKALTASETQRAKLEDGLLEIARGQLARSGGFRLNPEGSYPVTTAGPFGAGLTQPRQV